MGIVRDNVTIAYRGAKYELGRGSTFFGIWAAGASRSQPLQWWPDTPEGWAAAWSRFTEIETPGTILPVDRRAASAGPGAAPAAERAFAAGQGGIPAGRRAAGAGLSLVTFGLYFADAGTAMAGGLHLADAGLVLGIAGWLACAAGSAIAVLLPAGGRPGPFRPGGNPRTLGRPRGAQIAAAILLVLSGLGAAIAFAPSWDSFTLRTATGQSQSLTAGNAFANPGPVIAGDVAVMVALGAVVIAAALWRPVRHGAALLIGATIPMVAQAISALIQAGEAVTPQQFGLSPAQAQRLGLTISSGL